jgi:hypothetical protein
MGFQHNSHLEALKPKSGGWTLSASSIGDRSVCLHFSLAGLDILASL